MNIYVSEVGGEVFVSLTGVETEEGVKSQMDDCEKLIHFFRLNNEYREYSEEGASFEAIEVLSCIDSIREVLENIFTTIYRLGR